MQLERLGMLGGLVALSLSLVPAFGQKEDADQKVETFQIDALAVGGEIWMLTDSEFDTQWVVEEGDAEERESGEPDLKVFEWLSSARNAARYQGTSSRARLVGRGFVQKRREARLGEVPVGETIVRFREGQVTAVDVSVFNRGDHGIIREEKFEGLLREAAGYATEVSGAPMEKPGKRSTSAVRAERMIWRGKNAYYELEYSFRRKGAGKPFVGEFIKLKIAPPSAGGIMAGAAKSKLADRRSLRDRVEKRDNGDVLITTLPMVDQGDKGYCAVASAERVLRYYGLEVDQHEMAQIAGSSASAGTGSDQMKEALESVAGRLKVRLRTQYESFDRYEEYERLIKRYNRAAKDKPDAGIFEIRKGWVFYYGTLYQKGHPEALKEAIAHGGRYDRFKKDVYENIDAGVPPLWSLYLGVFPEENIPQPSGGHMRCVIGYNKKTDELIFSDSWGAGHEEKRMPFDEAFTMTLGLRVLVPSR